MDMAPPAMCPYKISSLAIAVQKQALQV